MFQSLVWKITKFWAYRVHNTEKLVLSVLLCFANANKAGFTKDRMTKCNFFLNSGVYHHHLQAVWMEIRSPFGRLITLSFVDAAHK